MPRPKRNVPWLDTRDDVYHVFWYDAVKRRTERFSLRTKDPGEAAHRYAAFLTQGRDIYSGEQRAGLTCGAAFDYYEAEHVKPNAVDKQRIYDCIKNLRLFFNDTQAKDVDIPMSREYAAKRMSGELCLKTKHGKVRKASAGTVKRELTTLVAAINHCKAWKKPGISKSDDVSIEKPKTKRSKGLWMFHAELAALRDVADQKTRDFIDVAYFTAGRRKSVETLTVFQVNQTLTRVNLAKPDDPETKKRKPMVPVAVEIIPVLRRLIDESTDGTLFGKGYSAWSGWKAARKKAGLRYLDAKDMRPAGSLSPHVLRHSRATHLLQSGAKPKFVADLLGDDIMTVLRVYGHACPDWMANEMGLQGEE